MAALRVGASTAEALTYGLRWARVEMEGGIGRVGESKDSTEGVVPVTRRECVDLLFRVDQGGSGKGQTRGVVHTEAQTALRMAVSARAAVWGHCASHPFYLVLPALTSCPASSPPSPPAAALAAPAVLHVRLLLSLSPAAGSVPGPGADPCAAAVPQDQGRAVSSAGPGTQGGAGATGQGKQGAWLGLGLRA